MRDCSIRRFRQNYHFYPPAKVWELSAVSGMLPQSCRAFPLPADCPCTFAGRFRSQRMLAAEVQGISAASGCCRKVAGRFRCQRMAPAKVREPSTPVENALQKYRAFSTRVKTFLQKCRAFSTPVETFLQKCRRVF